jgi:predicted membrane chloride channel (bestrophin family)
MEGRRLNGGAQLNSASEKPTTGLKMLNRWSPWELCRQSSWRIFFQTYYKALALACVGAATSAALRYFRDRYHASSWDVHPSSDSAYASFTLFLSLVFAFRTGQAYNRFWEGVGLVHGMIGDWYDAASSIVAFCDHSQLDRLSIRTFQHLIVRLFSLQTALILSELEGTEDGQGTAMTYNLVDIQGIDTNTLQLIIHGDNRPEIVFQKIQRLIVHHMKSGVLSVPAPILTRVFQEMGSGMLKYHEAVKLSHVPFPWPYRVLTEILLMIHLILSPILMARWASTPGWAAFLAGGQIFIMWSLAALNKELDNPFKQSGNDLDCEYIQHEINIRLVRLLEVADEPLPSLSASAKVDPSEMLLEQKHVQPQLIAVGERKAKLEMRKQAMVASGAKVESIQGLARTLNFLQSRSRKDHMSPPGDERARHHPVLRAQYGSPSMAISSFTGFFQVRPRSPGSARSPTCNAGKPFDRHGDHLHSGERLKAPRHPEPHAVTPVTPMTDTDSPGADPEAEVHGKVEGHGRWKRISEDTQEWMSPVPGRVPSAPPEETQLEAGGALDHATVARVYANSPHLSGWGTLSPSLPVGRG